MLFLCVILHTMSWGKSMQLLCILPFVMLCLSAISMMFVKILLAVCILVGMVVWAKVTCVLVSPTLFNIYTSDTTTPQVPVKLTTYEDDITITSTHNDINIAKASIQSYLHELRQTTSSSTQTRQHHTPHRNQNN